MSEDGDAHDGQDNGQDNGQSDAPARPSPGPSVQPQQQPQPDPAPQTHTRRWVLAGAGAVLLAGGAGVGAAFLQGRGTVHHRPPRPPAPLVAAAAAERALIADLDATTGGDAAVRDVIRAARADHAAHLSALEGLLARYPQPGAGGRGTPAPTGSRTPPPPRGTARTRAQLRAAEQAAAAAAAHRAAAVDGATAALLASIAACEAVHAELFA